MTELGMSWEEIKKTPRYELTGLLKAYQNYMQMHHFDGYSAEDVSNLAKDKPQIRSDYAKYMELNAVYERRAGKKEKTQSLSQMLGVS